MSEALTTPPQTAAAPGSPKRPYRAPRVEEFGSVSKLTTAKTGTPTDAGMPMSTCL
jgi:hypothetical protein